MKKSRFSEEKIIAILRKAEAGSPDKGSLCGAISVRRPATLGKRKFEGIEVSEATRLRTLEEENSRPKRLVADPAVQIHILKEVNAKSGEPLSARRRAVKMSVEEGIGKVARECRAPSRRHADLGTGGQQTRGDRTLCPCFPGRVESAVD